MFPQSATPGEEPAKTRIKNNPDGSAVIYHGFPAMNNPTTSEPAWAIRQTKVSPDGTEIDQAWANGNRDKTCVFDQRESYKYKTI
ncbi:MAG TPA: hypothetical protein DEO70_12305 [Bacteroidales bacterium]|nr:MAG: hypothetical protein A2X11_13030 [Bacteroidetes bacterium GWE2_42_24]OFY25331.1 MAG: hypothetical protein A2X09_10230 [Bacteroidetes bacterium GWF2_43_11]HBZ67611.1 hypothetical protein [Bacteroidales bacterium]